MKQVIALLPMKDHSERIANKNMKSFNGLPLYHAIVNVLSQSNFINRIVINTDSERIAADAEKNFSNIQIIWRPEEIQGDFISMNDIIAYDLGNLEEEHFLQTHSTNPLLTIETINQAVEVYFNNLEKYDSLFSVTRFQTRFYWADGKAINHNPDELIRTQDLPPIFEENSNFYIFSKKSFKKANNKRIGLRPFLFEINKSEAIDIDNPDDFELAEILYKINSTVPK